MSVVTGKRAVLEAIRSGRATEVLVSGSARRTEGLRELLTEAERSGTPVREVLRGELDALARNHRGVAAIAGETPELSERELADRLFGDDAIVVVLDGVTDPQNLGACARAAEAAGAEMLVTRVKRAAGVTAAAIRASAGALMLLPHARVANIPRALGRLKDSGFTVVGLEASTPNSIYDEACPSGRIALVIGSEGSGMSRLVRESCDLLLSVPMRGQVQSLNAAATASVALFAYVLPSRR
ncbi:MAG: 23S rRNA (guanosine(2251)-2'-O)-methyltransferase RlmB [Actinomycetota bacterium]